MKPSIHITTRRYDGRPQRHAHGYGQAILPVAGRMAVGVSGRCVEAAPHRALLIGPYAVHDFEADASARFVVLDIGEADLVGRFFTEPLASRAIDAQAAGYIAFLATAPVGEQRLAQSPSAAALALELLESSSIDTKRTRRQAGLDDIYRPLCADTDGRLTNTDLADTLYLSTRAFQRAFKARFGRSPKQVQIEARLSEAAARLANGTASVGRIAEAVGYGDASTFIKRFTARYGDTPHCYRQRVRKDR